MAISQRRARRKKSGSRYKEDRKKRLFELGNKPTLTRLDARKVRVLRVMGGNKKVRILRTDVANVTNKEGKSMKLKILNIVENEANAQFVRRNIFNKGSIIETEKGKAKVTSRPGQDGTVNAVLI